MATAITELYRQLFGKGGLKDGDVISMSEHGRVGGLSTGQPFKFVSMIDPATGTANPLPAGASTLAKQDTQISLETQISSLTETLQELVQRLAPLAGAMSNTAQLRTVVTGAVTATGGGYITSAQHIANTLTQTNTLRYDPNNTLAIQSNINNCVVT